MNTFFNKYSQDGDAQFNDFVALPSGYLNVGQKGQQGLIVLTDIKGIVIWEKLYQMPRKSVKFLHVEMINPDQVMILGNAMIGAQNTKSHLCIKANINGQIIFTKEIISPNTTKSSKLLKLSENEWVISGWKNVNTTSTEYHRINLNGQSSGTFNLRTQGNDKHFDLALLDRHLVFVGSTILKENKEGLILLSEVGINSSQGFTLTFPDPTINVEIDSVASIGRGKFLIAGHNDTDIFITFGNYASRKLVTEPLRMGFLNGSFKVLKIIYRQPFAYLMAFDVNNQHHFVIKFNMSITNPNKAKIWIRYIGPSEIAILSEMIINDDGFLFCGKISEREKKKESPILISANNEVECCKTENGPNDTREIKPIFLNVLEIEIISGQLDAENLSVEFTTFNNQSQIVEICSPIVTPIQKCPFAMTAWNTIEPRARTRDFTKALQAEVRDAMWMISRQWQWGEFDGEDGGSIVYSKVGLKTTKLNRYTQLEKSPKYEAYNDQEPLEYTVERGIVDIEKNWLLRIETGNYWLKLLKTRFENTVLEELKQGFISQYAVQLHEPEPIIDELTKQAYIKHLQLKANEETWLMLVSSQNRTIDGWEFIKAIQDGTNFSHIFITTLSQVEKDKLQVILVEFKSKYDHLFFNESKISSSWSTRQLEHTFECRSKNTDTSKGDFKVIGKEYSGKNLDWIDMDIAVGGKDFLDKPGATIENPVPESDVNILIPSKIFFPGMPEARWWQMEDSQIDFGNMIVNKTDVSKLLLLDFMVNYAGNWYMLPHAAEVGTLTEIQGIEVRDNFGIRTLIQPANIVDPPVSTQRKWSVFQLHNESDPNKVPPSLLFLAPSTPDKLEGKPIEKVNFIRDEMANMVWGIEQTINSGMNKGTDGNEAGIRLQQLLKKYNENLEEDDVTENENNENILKYKLATSVPENWIPFIPVNTDTSNRSIKLRRAQTLRAIENFAGQIKPRTDLLSPLSPYFINEEEVPKAGRIVEAKWQRARWFDGKTFVWYGHEKKVGRGGGTSGLKFDQLEYPKK